MYDYGFYHESVDNPQDYLCDGKYIDGMCAGGCAAQPTHFIAVSPHEKYAFCDEHYAYFRDSAMLNSPDDNPDEDAI